MCAPPISHLNEILSRDLRFRTRHRKRVLCPFCVHLTKCAQKKPHKLNTWDKLQLKQIGVIKNVMKIGKQSRIAQGVT